MQPTKLPARARPRNWATRLIATAGILAGLSTVGDIQATPAAFTFTAPNPGWVVARLGGVPLGDVEGDTPGARDLVGDAANPMLYIASDATHLYFRLRVDDDPLQDATSFGPFGWGCLIDTDNNPQTFEYSTVVDGVNNPDQIHFYRNTVTTTTNSPTEPPDMPSIVTTNDPLQPAVKHAESVVAGSTFHNDTDFFMDWAIELAPALAAGFNPANPARYYCGSANNGSQLGADCSGSATCGTLDSQFTDPIACGPLGCAICGDGQKGAAEGCDDGNLNNGDGCNSQCLLELGRPCAGVSTSCASGFCDPTGNICACDQDADCPNGQNCNTALNPNQCVPAGCGNGILEAGEGCDDNNLTNGDGCNAQCLKELGQACAGNSMVCASGFCDPAGNTCACDQDVDCSDGKLCNTSGAPNVCVDPGCGNGVLEINEGCDDGNTTPGDGCNSTCLLEIGEPCTLSGHCASDACDPTSGTCECDDDADCPMGNVCDMSPDPNACVPSGCGNGIVEAGEGCDDGNIVDGDGCTAMCTKELGQMCTDGTECNSGNCDGTTNACVCNVDDDCPMGQVCDTKQNPHACVPPDGCKSDTDCSDGLFCDEPSGQCVECTQDSECTTAKESTQNICDVSTFTCVECLVDAHCPDKDTCTAGTHTCRSQAVIVEGGGILCAASTTATNDNNLPFALLGLLALGMTRRRRR